MRTVGAEEVKQQFRARGINIANWAARNGFRASVVYALLDGRTRGLRGQAYLVAQALGMTPTPDRSGRFEFLEDDQAPPQNEIR